jgi:hypothetical protein
LIIVRYRLLPKKSPVIADFHRFCQDQNVWSKK